jgi:hypothetical protein
MTPVNIFINCLWITLAAAVYSQEPAVTDDRESVVIEGIIYAASSSSKYFLFQKIG